MAYPLMTAEQYVVNKLQDLEVEKAKLLEEIGLLREEINGAEGLLNQLCKKMSVHHSENNKYNFITWDYCVADDYDPELFAELKRRIETHEV